MIEVDVDTILSGSNPGVAKYAKETFSQFGLLLSDNPQPLTLDYVLKKGETVKLWQVVGVDDTDPTKLVVSTGIATLPAAGYGTDSAGLIWPIGIAGMATSRAAGSADSEDDRYVVPVWVAGHWNIDALEWDDSWFQATDDDDDAGRKAQDKRLIDSMIGMPSPGQMKLGFNRYHRRPARTP